MLTLYLLQTFVPLLLIAWLAFAPPRSWAGYTVQAVAIGVALFAIAMTGIWAFPPWWAIYVFAALLVASVLVTFIRHRPQTMWPASLFGWLSLSGFLAFGLFFANEARLAFSAIRLPTQATLALASPLGPGTYLVANGGAGTSVNAHAELLDQSIARHKPYWGTAHGVDLIALDRWGLRASGLMPADPKSYVIFGRPVIAPCAGEVVSAVDDLPDLQVPQMDHDHLAGNHVILRCQGGDILLGHFHKGSVRVRVGQKLKIGEFIAQVGNSGNTSEPHLHINAMKPGTAIAPFAGAPIPIQIDGQYLVRNDRFVVRESPAQP
jgi:hypothetical protein